MGLKFNTWEKGDAYERYVGRWSRLVAHEFLDWLNLPPSLRWLDVGCGTGALTATIREKCQPTGLVGIDSSEGFVVQARTRLAGHATFCVAHALDLPLRDSAVDVVVSGLVLNFVPNTALALAQMRRTAVAGGTIAAYVWDYADKMELMRYFWDTAVELSSAARELDEDNRFPLCHPDALEIAFRHAGLSAIQVKPIDIATRFSDFDDYWTPFLGGQGPAPAYAMSLDEASRKQLRDRIRQRLPTESDGSIPLIARAWAIQGRVGNPK